MEDQIIIPTWAWGILGATAYALLNFFFGTVSRLVGTSRGDRDSKGGRSSDCVGCTQISNLVNGLNALNNRIDKLFENMGNRAQ